MNDIDIVILSNAKNSELRSITEKCLSSLQESEQSGDISFKTIVVESSKTAKDYVFSNTETLRPTASFGYHRYLNIGLKKGSSPFVCLCNNDLIFNKKWASSMMDVASKYSDIMSFSPIDHWLHNQFEGFAMSGDHMVGYEKMRHFTGWCFLVRRALFDQIGFFDERFKFWYCDDDVIETYKKHKIKHALVTGSVVKHLGSKTINAIESAKLKKRLTDDQWLYFDYKWNHHSRFIWILKILRMQLIRVKEGAMK